MCCRGRPMVRTAAAGGRQGAKDGSWSLPSPGTQLSKTHATTRRRVGCRRTDWRCWCGRQSIASLTHSPFFSTTAPTAWRSSSTSVRPPSRFNSTLPQARPPLRFSLLCTLLPDVYPPRHALSAGGGGGEEGAEHTTDAGKQAIVVNTHLLFPYNSNSTIIQLRESMKVT